MWEMERFYKVEMNKPNATEEMTDSFYGLSDSISIIRVANSGPMTSSGSSRPNYSVHICLQVLSWNERYL
uniref:Uncharacterized protein n=1 Tax=Ditylenchus dipsaci TaxID=166011 RepID=A0A915EWS3_9BILA